jgi:hypothetical protein
MIREALANYEPAETGNAWTGGLAKNHLRPSHERHFSNTRRDVAPRDSPGTMGWEVA